MGHIFYNKNICQSGQLAFLLHGTKEINVVSAYSILYKTVTYKIDSKDNIKEEFDSWEDFLG